MPRFTHLLPDPRDRIAKVFIPQVKAPQLQPRALVHRRSLECTIRHDRLIQFVQLVMVVIIDLVPVA